MRMLSIIAIATSIFAIGAAQADVKTDCASDVKSYCAGVQPKGGKLRDCMAENRAKLSNTCKLAVADRLLERQAKKASGTTSSKDGKGMAPNDDE